jgi:Zn-dependent peptidase ImmA (M78 family)
MDDNIRRSRLLFQNPYAYLNGDGAFDAAERRDRSGAVLEPNAGRTKLDAIDLNQLLGERRRGDRFSEKEIAEAARGLQNILWQRRAALGLAEDIDPIEILDPAIAFGAIDFTVEADLDLGELEERGERSVVAGVLDRRNQKVQVASQLAPHVRNFTLAHELGHLVLHQGSGLHRDRALDGSGGNRSSDRSEVEADLFAAFFLMPEKLVRPAFSRRFAAATFIIDEVTAFALRAEPVASVRRRFRNVRDLARHLASTELYNGVPFESLATEFRLSVEAMAIRLEQLALVSDRSFG